MRHGHDRRRRVRYAASLALVLPGLAIVSAGHQARDIGSPTAPAPAGTGQIAGVIVDAQARPQPVHRAIVTLAAAELPAGRAVVSDDQGHFSFDRLPAGHFTLAASKPAYLKMTYGAVRPGGVGTPITLAADQQVTDLRMTLPHGGAIAGTIRDVRGDPVPGIQVSVIRTSVPAGPAPLRGDAVTTDDRGAFRAFGLLPGTYVVAAAPGMSGGLGEIGQMSSTEIDAAFARLRQGATGAQAAATARASSPSSIVRPTRPLSTAPVFYPGVTAAGAASSITLGLGEERAGIDFVYQLARSAAVSGTVVGAESQANVQVMLSADDSNVQIGLGLGVGPASQRGGAPGTFLFTNVTPGRYTLMARSGGSPGGRAGAPVSPLPLMFVMAPIEVAGEDVRGLAFTLQPALHVSGRLTFQAASMTPPADLTKIRVRLSPVSPGGGAPVQFDGAPVQVYGGIAQWLAAMTAVKSDGTFVIDGVPPGSYRISTIGEPGGWRAKSAMAGDQDVFDTPLDVGSNDVVGVEITLSDRHSQVNGRLLLASGAPASRYFVVAFPADRALWLPQSRRMKSARPSTDGQFHLDDLPAGDYYLAALTDANQDDWQSPAFLAQAIAAGVKLTLGDGETKTQDLKVNK